MELFKSSDEVYIDYKKRTDAREWTLLKATSNFKEFFISLGDFEDVAKDKVTQISSEVAPMLYAYVLGNRQPLIDKIDSSELVFMTQDAKNYLTSQLLENQNA